MTMQDDGGCGMFQGKDEKKQRSAFNSDDLLGITKAFDLDKVNIAKETAIKFIKDKRGKTNQQSGRESARLKVIKSYER